ncbi:hypothetical protein Droror1_Dr00015356 [Drosera rotundifolia]
MPDMISVMEMISTKMSDTEYPLLPVIVSPASISDVVVVERGCSMVREPSRGGSEIVHTRVEEGGTLKGIFEFVRAWAAWESLRLLAGMVVVTGEQDDGQDDGVPWWGEKGFVGCFGHRSHAGGLWVAMGVYRRRLVAVAGGCPWKKVVVWGERWGRQENVIV